MKTNVNFEYSNTEDLSVKAHVVEHDGKYYVEELAVYFRTVDVSDTFDKREMFKLEQRAVEEFIECRPDRSVRDAIFEKVGG